MAYDPRNPNRKPDPSITDPTLSATTGASTSPPRRPAPSAAVSGDNPGGGLTAAFGAHANKGPGSLYRGAEAIDNAVSGGLSRAVDNLSNVQLSAGRAGTAALPSLRMARPSPPAAAPPPAAPTAAPPTAPALRQGPRASVPARSAPAPSPTAAGAVTAPAQVGRPVPSTNLVGQRGTVASAVGRFGENVYDNASVGRLTTPPAVGRPQPAAAAAAVPAAVQPPPQSYQAPGYGMRPDPSAERERQAQLSRIDSDLSSLGTLNSRGKRAMAQQLRDQRQQLVLDRFGQATDLAKTGAQLDVEGGNAALGANSAAARDAAGLQDNERARQFAAAQGQTEQLEDGSLYSIRGDGTARPVAGPDGRPLKGRPKVDPALQIDRARAAINDSAAEVYAAMLQNLPPPGAGEEIDYAALTAQARQRAMELAGVREDPKTGKAYINVNGQVVEL